MIGSRARLRALRWGLRAVFGLPQPVKRALAGRRVEFDGQVLDLDLQLLGRIDRLLASPAGGTVDQAALAEQRRQADLAAEIVADARLDDIVTEDLQVPGGAGPLAARLYIPPAVPETAGLIVYFHGGGFALGSLASTDPLCRLLAAQSGVRVLSVDYRLAPEYPYPAALEDAIAAYHGARADAAVLGADPELIAVGGDSAGANLALVVAQQQATTGGPLPAFVLALYPVTDIDRSGGSRELFGNGFGLTAEYIRELERLYLPDGVPSDDTRGAILRADDLSGMPPVYLATAGFDPLRDEGEELAERLNEAGVPVVARRFPGLVHGYASFTAVCAAARDATLDAASALRAALALVESRQSAALNGRAVLGSLERARTATGSP
ncbi:alpha/beta hydrolase [Pseudonocardia alaniniphila]|uniref:Alpha/beta hydrolase n=1 Tax=Pseudonocardia alaniniphila TaxID=75291 RepID=A0ABS9TMI4_9PSEU|nr:alpha/beta hydrolase [Pseudonocardia alaniniphila]MCH6169737.1 alpha/beta hydrolase [Pseudonocardia alaniniphila]